MPQPRGDGSRSLVKHGPATAASGGASAAARPSSQLGETVQCPSRNTTNSPEAWSAPRLRARATPRPPPRTSRIRGVGKRSYSSVLPSVDPSSTTMISKSGYRVRLRMLCVVIASSSPSLSVGMTTLKRPSDIGRALLRERPQQLLAELDEPARVLARPPELRAQRVGVGGCELVHTRDPDRLQLLHHPGERFESSEIQFLGGEHRVAEPDERLHRCRGRRRTRGRERGERGKR